MAETACQEAEHEIASVDAALDALHIRPDDEGVTNPVEDERWERLESLVKQRLRQSDRWVTDERLIVFTEYKTTLDYLTKRLRAEFKDDGRTIRVLFGGDDCDREAIKNSFNDSDDPVRILVATDAASEGMNLQETARLLLHFDVPWNPSRLEQRNGRLDRHGQARRRDCLSLRQQRRRRSEIPRTRCRQSGRDPRRPRVDGRGVRRRVPAPVRQSPGYGTRDAHARCGG